MISNAEKLKTSIHDLFAKNRGPRTSFSKLIGSKVTVDPTVDINFRCVLNLMNFGLTSINTTNKLGFISVPKTRVRRPTDSSDWLQQVNINEESGGQSEREKSNQRLYFKDEFETMREILDFEREMFYEY